MNSPVRAFCNMSTIKNPLSLTRVASQDRRRTKKQILLGGNILLAATICTILVPPSAQAQVQWANRIASTTNLPAAGGPLIGLTLDSQANCYVTGWFDGTNN